MALFSVPQVGEHGAPLCVSVHITPVLDVPVTVAVNCCILEVPTRIIAVLGLTVTTMGTGLMVTVALADFVGSATLVAVTVAVHVEGTEAGAE